MSWFSMWRPRARKKWRLTVFLSTRAPLAALLRYGELTTRPTELRSEWGGWVPVTPTFREIGVDIDEPPPGLQASEIGPVPQDGGDFLPFLIEYRRIIESDANRDGMVSALKALETKSPHIAKKLGEDLARLFVCRELLELPGCGKGIADKLYSAGYLSKEQVICADPKELSSIRGLGPAVVERLQSGP